MKIVNTTLLLFFLAIGTAFIAKKKKAVNEPVVSSVIPENKGTTRDAVIAYAKTYLGTAYKYASASPEKGFDCSGFVNYVYKHFGVALPRSSSGFKNLSHALKPTEFKLGDVLIFYGHKNKTTIGHVGIICEANGMKSKFIHASSGKEMAVTISELGSKGYTQRFYKCINVLKGA